MWVLTTFVTVAEYLRLNRQLSKGNLLTAKARFPSLTYMYACVTKVDEWPATRRTRVDEIPLFTIHEMFISLLPLRQSSYSQTPLGQLSYRLDHNLSNYLPIPSKLRFSLPSAIELCSPH
jgi:hypothetical protein